MIERLQVGSAQAVKVMEKGSEQATLSVEQAAEAGAALERINRAVETITALNTQIASAAEEQSSVAEDINSNIAAISEASNQTAVGAEQTASASADVAQQAHGLQGLVGQFKL